MAAGAMTDIICAGGLFLAKSTQRFLFLLRAQGKTANTWGLAGGKKEPHDNTIYDTLQREIEEEIGFKPIIDKTVPIEHYASKDNQFNYNTYVLLVKEEFIPTLNKEHFGYCWVTYDNWPKQLHQGVKATLSSKTTRTKLETILDII